jgi:hypothetical protein
MLVCISQPLGSHIYSIVSAILSSLGSPNLDNPKGSEGSEDFEDSDSDDHTYYAAKAFDFSQRIEDSNEIREEEERIKGAGDSSDRWPLAEELDDDLSGSELGLELDGEEEDEAGEPKYATGANRSKRERKPLNLVQKLRLTLV